MIGHHAISAKDLLRLHQFGKKGSWWHLHWLCVVCGWNLERRFWLQTLRSWKSRARPESMLGDTTQRKFSRQSMEMNSKFRAQMERSSWQEKVKKSVHPSQLRIHPTEESRIAMAFSENRTNLIQPKNNQRMKLKPEMIWGVFLKVTFMVITFT